MGLDTQGFKQRWFFYGQKRANSAFTKYISSLFRKKILWFLSGLVFSYQCIMKNPDFIETLFLLHYISWQIMKHDSSIMIDVHSKIMKDHDGYLIQA